MIPLAAFIVETDNSISVPAIKEPVLEQVRAAGNRLRNLPDDDLHDRTIGKNKLRAFNQRCRNHVVIYDIGQPALSITPTLQTTKPSRIEQAATGSAAGYVSLSYSARTEFQLPYAP